MDRRKFNRAIFITLAILTAINIHSCKKVQTEVSNDGGLDLTSRFIPQEGTRLQSMADVPGVTWSFDTVRGVGEPDTLILWTAYEGVDYMTNVVGTSSEIKYLEKSGLKKMNDMPVDFTKLDFKPKAIVVSNGLDFTRQMFNEMEDSMFRYKKATVEKLITDFFMSGGAIEYMSEPMASNWRIIHTQTENGEMEPANPFNAGPAAEFKEGSIRIDMVNPRAGIAEVSAYCLDPFTLGAAGWAYWTVIFCKKDSVYLIKETPIYHNRFVVG